jgi:ABC-type transport system, involved in lipoprotein release, permease component
MLFNLAFSNIKKNFKNYGAYFLSCSFSIFALYLFMSILYSKTIQEQLGAMKKFLILFDIGAVMIILFSAFFIWYSNSFFIKSRKKEFATYMLLGMSKKHVSWLNFFENMVIMALALFTGVILGLIFTKFFIMLLFFMIRTSTTVAFQWNFKALKFCLTTFLIVFLIITLHGFTLIRRSNLIDLFNGAKKAERGLKVSIITYILAFVALVCLSYGYYIAIKKLGANLMEAPITVFLVVIGTVLFFTSTTSLIIYFNKRNERKLFKGTRLISTAQLYYRYRGNVGTLSVIAITTTIALCALVTCVGSYSKTEENSRYMRPFSIEYYTDGNSIATFEQTLKKHTEISVKYSDTVEFIQTELTDPLTKLKTPFYIINESNFDIINSHENVNRKANLQDKNNCYFIQMQAFVTNEAALGKKLQFTLGNESYEFNITATDMKPYLALDHFNETLVVKDSVFNEMKSNVEKEAIKSIKGYVLSNDFKAESFIVDLNSSMPKESNFLTFYDHYKDGLKLLGMMAFIGLFIGLLFITATGSIIYFKMTMEAREDRERFITLSKIGVSKTEIKTAVAKELLLLFGSPMLFAAINTYPATKALSTMLSMKLTSVYLLIVLVYGLIYSLYYFVTLNSYISLVTE